MRDSTDNSSRALNRFVWFLAALTLFLICSGGMVTSKNFGLAVPDWPTTFGYNMFFFPFSQWVGGIFFEHTHRLIASLVGFLTIVLAVWIWKVDSRRWLRILGVVALVAVIVQGVLGGLRVTMLKDEIGIFHALLAQAFFALLVFIGLATSHAWRSAVASAVSADPRDVATRQPSALRTAHATASSFRTTRLSIWLPVVTTVLIYLQLGLGATMRHQHRDLSILDFPAAYGRVIPDVSAESLQAINQWRAAWALSEVTAGQIWLQMAHRFVALLISAGVIAFWFAVRRQPAGASTILIRLSAFWAFFLAIQITLGAWTIWSNKAADIATAHVAVGATMLALGVSVCAILARSRASARDGRYVPHGTYVTEEVHAL